MIVRCVSTTVLLLTAVCAIAQDTGDARKFALYPMDKSCDCVRTKHETASTSTKEEHIGNRVYQVFWSRTIPKRELFRIEVGNGSGHDAVMLWNYGIANEGDFNGDGVPDYAWYGGDDTSSEMYLFLSAGSHYERIDVLKTVQIAWQQRFHTSARDLGESDGRHALDNVVLQRSAAGLVLLAKVIQSEVNGTIKGTYQFRIARVDFRP